MTNKYTDRIKTSNYSEHVEICISRKKLEFLSLPWYNQFDTIQVIIKNDKTEYFNERIIRNKECLNLPDLPEGLYSLILYVSSSYVNASNCLFQICYFKLEVSDKNYRFIRPYSYQNNLDFLNNISGNPNELSRCVIGTKDIQCFDTEIVTLSKEICKFSHNNYNKLLCIHDWIAEKMFYDEDSVKNKSFKTDRHNALKALKSAQQCVCSEFTLLSIALARAQGIPSIGICCKTANNDLWWEEKVSTLKADHIFAASWIENRWVLMDNTWDCVHKITNGILKKGYGGYKRQFFDITLDAISSTHCFVEVYA